MQNITILYNKVGGDASINVKDGKVMRWESVNKSFTLSHRLLLFDTYMRCVESGVQSGRYLAPMSRAFSLSSPLKGFWKPLSTNTTPSIIRLNGTDCALSGFSFFCLGLGSGLDWLSRRLSADFCAAEAGGTICKKSRKLSRRRRKNVC